MDHLKGFCLESPAVTGQPYVSHHFVGPSAVSVAVRAAAAAAAAAAVALADGDADADVHQNSPAALRHAFCPSAVHLSGPYAAELFGTLHFFEAMLAL